MQKLKNTLITILVLLVITSFSSFKAVAQEQNQAGESDVTAGQEAENVVTQETRNATSNMGTQSALNIRERIKQKLEGQKLRVCEQKSKLIQTRSRNITKHMNRQIAVFDKIASRTGLFYNNTIVERGDALDNYDQLIENITVAKEKAYSFIEASEDTAEAFNCSSENPRDQLAQFKSQSKDAIAAMQEYKTAVKELIVAVAKLANEVESIVTTTTVPVSVVSEN